jgi:hypothetical protein
MILRARPCRAPEDQMFFLLTLPFRLFFGLIFGVLILSLGLFVLPFLLLRLVLKAAILLVALPFALVAIGLGLLVAFSAVLFVLMIPLLPVAFLALFIWAFVRLVSRPALSPS